ncbi:MAG TPA: helix-turn-helix domain-containing protein [Nocardioidaceae bacterium]|nr:helix-turn-helix domain-containing protein [Nocardioidaceae bacterium]
MTAEPNGPDPDLTAIAALDEPTRRRLYDFVATAPEPIGRDEAAAALGLPRSNAAFHLDRLVDQGLLETTYARRSGRTGPGAGRPAKLYRRTSRQISVNLPARKYDLAGRLLAGAIEESTHTGEPAAELLARQAHRVGAELGAEARPAPLLETLQLLGFEPRGAGDQIRLGNCPFRDLAADYPDTVCRMNLHLVDGLLSGLADDGWTAEADPEPGPCCVRLGRQGPRR